MDYLTISRNIQETMEKAGCPLSEDQYAVLVGSLAVYIELQGTQDKSLSPGWLKNQFEEITQEIENWPEWKRSEKKDGNS